MKYYETEIGLFAAASIPADAQELTEAQYRARISEIRATAVHIESGADEEGANDGEA